MTDRTPSVKDTLYDPAAQAAAGTERAPWDDPYTAAWLAAAKHVVGAGWPLPEGVEAARAPWLPHEQRLLGALSDWWASGERAGLVGMPPGVGRSRAVVALVLETVVNAPRTRGPVLWIAQREERVAEVFAALVRHAHLSPRAVAVGRFDSGRRVEEAADVVVASFGALAPLGAPRDGLERFRRVDSRAPALVIVDEAHEVTAPAWADAVRALGAGPATRVLGLSTSPAMLVMAGSAVAPLCGRVVHEEPAERLLEEGVLLRPALFPVRTPLVVDADDGDRAVIARFGELSSRLEQRLAVDAQRQELVLQTYLGRSGAFGPSVFYVSTPRQASHFVDRLNEADVPAGSMSLDIPLAERRQVLADFAAGRLLVVVSVGAQPEGSDAPSARTAFLVKPVLTPVGLRHYARVLARGPAAGGHERAHLVTFVDEVRGLDRPFYTGVSDEAALHAALGLGAVSTPMPWTALAARRHFARMQGGGPVETPEAMRRGPTRGELASELDLLSEADRLGALATLHRELLAERFPRLEDFLASLPRDLAPRPRRQAGG
jgi:superfamily II DNA or RNA helicase